MDKHLQSLGPLDSDEFYKSWGRGGLVVAYLAGIVTGLIAAFVTVG